MEIGTIARAQREGRHTYLQKVGEAVHHCVLMLSKGRLHNVLGVAGDVRVAGDIYLQAGMGGHGVSVLLLLLSLAPPLVGAWW